MSKQKAINEKAKKVTVVILSAELSTNSAMDNYTDSFRLEEVLKNGNVNYARAIGVYKGVKEISFVCNTTDENIDLFLDLAKCFNQESILVRDTRGVHLFYLNGEFPELIGDSLVQVSPKFAKTFDGYTLLKGAYYVVS